MSAGIAVFVVTASVGAVSASAPVHRETIRYSAAPAAVASGATRPGAIDGNGDGWRRSLVPDAGQAATGMPVVAGADDGNGVGDLALTAGDRTIPATALAAYKAAAARMATESPECGLQWQLLAAIGRIESDHGRDVTARITSAGSLQPVVLGPVLDGTAGNARILDTDQGKLDGDRQFDRAIGPMQFIPSTWRVFGRDGSGDGRADPNNVRDAALATATYLCAGSRDLRDGATLKAAILGYNHSNDYLAAVIAWTAVYAGRVPPVTIPDDGSDGGLPPGEVLDLPPDMGLPAEYVNPPDNESDPAPPKHTPPSTTTTPPPPASTPTTTPSTPTTTPTTPSGPTPPTGTPTPPPTGTPSPACPPSIALTGADPLTAYAIDLTGNHLSDVLRLHAAVQTGTPGTYSVRTVLTDKDGLPLVTGEQTVTLAAGASQLVLNLAGSAIGAAGADGPYLVKQITLSAQGKPATCVATLLAKPWQTEQLSAASFEGYTVSVDQLAAQVQQFITAGDLTGPAAATLAADAASARSASGNAALLAVLAAFRTDLAAAAQQSHADALAATRLQSMLARLEAEHPAAAPTPTPTATPSSPAPAGPAAAGSSAGG